MSVTPPGMTVAVKGRLEQVDGKKLGFSLETFDDRDQISSGTHDRFIIDNVNLILSEPLGFSCISVVKNYLSNDPIGFVAIFWHKLSYIH
jgi:hypothetical protein